MNTMHCPLLVCRSSLQSRKRNARNLLPKAIASVSSSSLQRDPLVTLSRRLEVTLPLLQLFGKILPASDPAALAWLCLPHRSVRRSDWGPRFLPGSKRSRKASRHLRHIYTCFSTPTRLIRLQFSLALVPVFFSFVCLFDYSRAVPRICD